VHPGVCLIRPRFSAGYQETSVTLLDVARGTSYSVAYLNSRPPEVKSVDNHDVLEPEFWESTSPYPLP
jgi:hypothetical protein